MFQVYRVQLFWHAMHGIKCNQYHAGSHFLHCKWWNWEAGNEAMSTVVQSQIKQLMFQTTSKKSTLSNQFIQKRDGLIFNEGQFQGLNIRCTWLYSIMWSRPVKCYDHPHPPTLHVHRSQHTLELCTIRANGHVKQSCERPSCIHKPPSLACISWFKWTTH